MQDYIDNNIPTESVIGEDGKVRKGIWIKKSGDDGVNHLARAGASSRFWLNLFGEGKRFYSSFDLDEVCFEDYAKKLIPRAVGYSKAMLEYFHRGRLTITPATNGITFRQIKLNVQNATPNEVMGAGQVTLIIHYKPVTETPLGGPRYLLHYPTDETVTTDYVYKVSAPQNVDLTTPRELTFDFSAETLPANYADMTMQLVYKGKLGNEEGAVAVSPVTPVQGINTDFHLNLPASGVFARTTNNTVDATFNELRLSALTDIPGGFPSLAAGLSWPLNTAWPPVTHYSPFLLIQNRLMRQPT